MRKKVQVLERRRQGFTSIEISSSLDQAEVQEHQPAWYLGKRVLESQAKNKTKQNKTHKKTEG